MQHCHKHTRNRHKNYHKGPPPSLASPRSWFNYADVNQTGSISQQNMIYAVSAHLLPTYKLQHNFIKSKVSAICSSCNIRPTDKTNIDRFLDLKLDKRLIEMEQDYERTFKAHRQTKNGI